MQCHMDKWCIQHNGVFCLPCKHTQGSINKTHNTQSIAEQGTEQAELRACEPECEEFNNNIHDTEQTKKKPQIKTNHFWISYIHSMNIVYPSTRTLNYCCGFQYDKTLDKSRSAMWVTLSWKLTEVLLLMSRRKYPICYESSLSGYYKAGDRDEYIHREVYNITTQTHVQ